MRVEEVAIVRSRDGYWRVSVNGKIWSYHMFKLMAMRTANSLIKEYDLHPVSPDLHKDFVMDNQGEFHKVVMAASRSDLTV